MSSFHFLFFFFFQVKQISYNLQFTVRKSIQFSLEYLLCQSQQSLAGNNNLGQNSCYTRHSRSLNSMLFRNTHGFHLVHANVNNTGWWGRGMSEENEGKELMWWGKWTDESATCYYTLHSDVLTAVLLLLKCAGYFGQDWWLRKDYEDVRFVWFKLCNIQHLVAKYENNISLNFLFINCD